MRNWLTSRASCSVNKQRSKTLKFIIATSLYMLFLFAPQSLLKAQDHAKTVEPHRIIAQQNANRTRPSQYNLTKADPKEMRDESKRTPTQSNNKTDRKTLVSATSQLKRQKCCALLIEPTSWKKCKCEKSIKKPWRFISGVECVWAVFIKRFITEGLNVDVVATLFLIIILGLFLFYLLSLWRALQRINNHLGSMNKIFPKYANILEPRRTAHLRPQERPESQSEISLQSTGTNSITSNESDALDYDNLKNEISCAMKKEGFLNHKWEEFTENLMSAQGNSTKQRNALQPGSFFDIDEILEEGVRKYSWLSMSLPNLHNAPSLLVGLGALGTFLGLTIGVTEAGITIEQSDKMEAGLKELLGSAGLAFVTSFFGLATSLIFSFLEKRPMSQARGQINELIRNIEKMFEFSPSEKILNQIEKQSYEQSKLLKNLSNDLAATLGNQLKEHCSDPLKEALNEMKSSLDDLKKIQQNFSDDLLKQLVDKMSGNLLSGVEESQRQAAQMIEDLKESLSEAVSQVKGGLKEAVSQGIEESNKAVQGVAKSMSTLLAQSAQEHEKITDEIRKKHRESLDQFTQSFSDILQRHKEINESVERLLQQSKQAVAQHSQLIEKQEKLMDRHDTTLSKQLDANQQLVSGFEKIIHQQKLVLEGLQACSSDISAASQSIGSTEDKIAQHLQTLQAATQIFQNSNDRLKNLWDGYERRFINVDENLKQAFDALVQQVHELNTISQRYVQKTTQHFGHALSVLGDKIDRLQKASESQKKEKTSRQGDQKKDKK